MAVSALIPKLRWANIGWFYHWGTKQYDFSKGKQVIGKNMRDVCKEVVESVPWEEVFDGNDWDSWGNGNAGLGWKTWSDSYGASAYVCS